MSDAAAREIHFVDPKSILVDRNVRQRTDININDLIPSISARGVLLPLLVQGSLEAIELIAGERRLKTAIFCEKSEVPIRFVNGLNSMEIQVIEFEENDNREDLPWQDKARAIYKTHSLGLEIYGEESWTVVRTAAMLSKSEDHVYKMLDLAKSLEAGDESVIKSDTIAQATTILSRRRQRVAGEVLNRILEIQKPEVEDEETVRDLAPAGDLPSPGVAILVDALERKPGPAIAPFRIINGDMHSFLGSFEDKAKFNFLHCDLPYGVVLNEQANQDAFEGGGYESTPDIYWAMCHSLAANWKKFMYPSAHVMFWISMNFYEETIAFFERAAGSGLIYSDLRIWRLPLIWHKTDNRGILPDPNRGPRNITEFALMMSTGDRKIAKPVANAYGCPTNKAESIHTNEKPEPMLKHFFSMFVDHHTRMLDPTCGSGSSIRAGETLRAESALGIEFNPEFAARSQSKLLQARSLRALSGVVDTASTLDSQDEE